MPAVSVRFIGEAEGAQSSIGNLRTPCAPGRRSARHRRHMRYRGAGTRSFFFIYSRSPFRAATVHREEAARPSRPSPEAQSPVAGAAGCPGLRARRVRCAGCPSGPSVRRRDCCPGWRGCARTRRCHSDGPPRGGTRQGCPLRHRRDRWRRDRGAPPAHVGGGAARHARV